MTFTSPRGTKMLPVIDQIVSYNHAASNSGQRGDMRFCVHTVDHQDSRIVRGHKGPTLGEVASWATPLNCDAEQVAKAAEVYQLNISTGFAQAAIAVDIPKHLPASARNLTPKQVAAAIYSDIEACMTGSIQAAVKEESIVLKTLAGVFGRHEVDDERFVLMVVINLKDASETRCFFPTAHEAQVLTEECLRRCPTNVWLEDYGARSDTSQNPHYYRNSKWLLPGFVHNRSGIIADTRSCQIEDISTPIPDPGPDFQRLEPKHFRRFIVSWPLKEGDLKGFSMRCIHAKGDTEIANNLLSKGRVAMKGPLHTRNCVFPNLFSKLTEILKAADPSAAISSWEAMPDEWAKGNPFLLIRTTTKPGALCPNCDCPLTYKEKNKCFFFEVCLMSGAVYLGCSHSTNMRPVMPAATAFSLEKEDLAVDRKQTNKWDDFLAEFPPEEYASKLPREITYCKTREPQQILALADCNISLTNEENPWKMAVRDLPW